MGNKNEVSADAERIAKEINNFVKEFREDSRQDRKRVYIILGVMGLFMAVIGSHIWGVILTMEDDMTEMNQSMKTMKGDMNSMSHNMYNMSSVMTTMKTMGYMTQSVAHMSTMTPAVQSMAVDTRHMGRDIDRMMPTNWFD